MARNIFKIIAILQPQYLQRELISRHLLRFSILAFVTSIMTTPVIAHSVSERFGDFYGGMLHPMTAIEHLLPIFALGLLAGQQEKKVARWMLLALPLGLSIGCLLAAFNPTFLFITNFNRFSFLVIGILVTCSCRIPLPLLVTIGLLCGVTHGYENGLGVTNETSLYLFYTGVVIAGLLLISYVAATTVSLQTAWKKIAVRVAGSWITAIGLLMMGLK